MRIIIAIKFEGDIEVCERVSQMWGTIRKRARSSPSVGTETTAASKTAFADAAQETALNTARQVSLTVRVRVTMSATRRVVTVACVYCSYRV